MLRARGAEEDYDIRTAVFADKRAQLSGEVGIRNRAVAHVRLQGDADASPGGVLAQRVGEARHRQVAAQEQQGFTMTTRVSVWAWRVGGAVWRFVLVADWYGGRVWGFCAADCAADWNACPVTDDELGQLFRVAA